MLRIIDRVLLAVLTAVLAAPLEGFRFMYFVLVVIIYTGFSYSFFDKKLHLFLCVGAGIMTLLDGSFSLLLVLMLYEACSALWCKRRSEVVVFAVTVAVNIVRAAFLQERLIELLEKYPANAALLAVTAALGIYLSYVSTGNMRLEKLNLRIRDDGEEMKRLLVQKNELIRSNQDREIAMATLNERNRIAREIHDNVGHLLSRSLLQMGALQAVYRDEPLASSLKQVSATLNESMDSIRKSVHRLHNEAFDLRGALEGLIAKNSEYRVNFDYDMSPEIPREIKYCIAAVVTEAFENVRRHSDAARVWITVMEHPAFYQFIFRDDGSFARIKESGIGLHNMRSRIEELGGSISFDAKKGFKIFANIPKGRDR